MVDFINKIFGGTDMNSVKDLFDAIFEMIKKFFKMIFDKETGFEETTAGEDVSA